MASKKKKGQQSEEAPKKEWKGLMSEMEGIFTELGIKEQKSFKPVPTGINVLDYYNARYFRNHETKEHELFTGMPMGKLILKIGYTGCGKEQPVSCKVQTPSGPRRIGDLKVGEAVFARKGTSTIVTGVFPQGVKRVYRVTFRDGTSTRAGSEHLWTVQHRTKKKWTEKTTSELIESGLTFPPRGYKWKVPLCEAVQYPEATLPIEPYLLGVMLGNGALSDGKVDIAVNREDYEEVVNRIAEKAGDDFEYNRRETGSCPHCYIADPEANSGTPNRIAAEVRKLGLDVLSGEKFIPELYKHSSVGQRIELLRGLMDTDGSSSKNRVRFHSTSRRLADGVCELVRSLGGVAIWSMNDRTDEGKPVEYTVNVRVAFNPFHTTRKGSQWRASAKNPPVKYIESIIEEGLEEQVCIMVEDSEQLYLTDDFIVTHNTTLCVQEAMELVRPYELGTVFHFDLENAWSDDRTADITGLSMETVKKKYRRLPPTSLDKIYAFVKKVIFAKRKAIEAGDPGVMVTDARTGELIPIPTVIILDTIATLQSEDVMNTNEEMGSLMFEKGAQAGANNAFAQRLTGMIGEVNITIYAINHVRVDPSPSQGTPKAKRVQYLNQDETCPGGSGFPQFADYFLKMVPCESLTNKMDEGFAIPGKIVRCTIVKSRLSYDGRQFELVFTANGFSNAWTNLHFLKHVKQVKGAGGNLFIEAPDGRQTQKFAQRNWEELYEGNQEFREIADARLEVELNALVPEPGSAAEGELLASNDQTSAEDEPGAAEA